MCSDHHLSMTYTDVRLPMRSALAQRTLHADGLMALGLLKCYLDDPSYDNMMNLLDEYPDHVVEFTAFSRGMGVLGWASCVWEVRRY